MLRISEVYNFQVRDSGKVDGIFWSTSTYECRKPISQLKNKPRERFVLSPICSIQAFNKLGEKCAHRSEKSALHPEMSPQMY